MSKLNANKKIGHDTIEGVSESEIKNVENKLNIKFPASYREFLLLAGNYTGNLRISEGHTSLKMLADDNVLKSLKDSLNINGLSINRPFWVFGEKDNFNQFYFFYLDDNTENPNVYGVTYGSKDSEPNPHIILNLNLKFSSFIDEVIDNSIQYLKKAY